MAIFTQPGRRARLKDIALAVGLSVNTVSRALAGKDAVSESTRAMIQAEAERLGYVPNAMARSLAVGSAMALGLVITNPSNPFYTTLISAIESRARMHGYSLVLMVSEENLENERRAATSLLRWGVDGAIVVAVQSEVEHWSRLRASGMPLVLVNRDLPTLDCDFVGIDFGGSAYRATCSLLDGQAKRVILLEEDLDVSSVKDRIAGFQRALRERGIAQETIIRVPTRRRESSTLPWDPRDAYQLARRLIRKLKPGTAIMAGSDYFALGVYRALQESNCKIPDEISVMGYGDHPFAAYLDPPLSSVRLPAEEVGVTAVDLLLQRLAQPDWLRPPQKVCLEADLVLRASTPKALVRLAEARLPAERVRR
jgi:LacI family transcriptional regulator